MHQTSKNKKNLIYRSSVLVSYHKHIVTLGTLHCIAFVFPNLRPRYGIIYTQLQKRPISLFWGNYGK